MLHTRESSELRLQTEQMGRSLTEWLRNQYADAPDALAQIEALAAMGPGYPVAFALACVLAGAPALEALMAYAFGWSENMVQAAIKAVPLGQSAGQRLLGTLAGRYPPRSRMRWRWTMMGASPSRPCWPFFPPGTRSSTRACSVRERTGFHSCLRPPHKGCSHF